MKAWESVQQNSANPLLQYLAEDAVIRKYLSATELATLMDHTNHIGYAPKKARELALELRQRLAV
jgi:adenylosuccinate lyase